MTANARLLVTCGGLLVSALGACAGSDTRPVGPEDPDTTTTPVITFIEMVPPQQYIDSLGVAQPTYARGYDADGTQFDSPLHPDLFTWASSDPSVVSVDPVGVTTGHSWGEATISVTVPSGLAESRWVRVADAVDPAWSLPLSTGTITGAVTVGRDGLTYVGSTDVALDITTWYAVSPQGTIAWSLELPLASPSVPAIGDDGTLYIDSRTNRPYQGRLIAVDPSGTVRWTLETDPNDGTLTPAIGPDGTIHTAGGDRLTAVTPQGEVLWTFLLDDRYFLYSSPAVAADGTIYIGGFDNLLYAINPDGSLRWTFEADDWIGSSPVIGPDGTVYFGCADGQLYAVTPDGTKRWSTLLDPRTFGVSWPPAVGPDGTVYVASGGIHAVDPSGAVRWTYPGSFQATTPVVGADGTVVADGGTLGGQVIVGLDPQGRLLWEVTIPDVHILAPPAIGSDGNILVGSFIPNSSPPPYTTTLHSFSINEPGIGTFDDAFWPTARGNRANPGRAGG